MPNGEEPGKQPTTHQLLAIVNRAATLHNGFPPRSVQQIALLSLLHPTTGKGRLVQINTGEGKSLTTAMFAAVLALQGKKVDVVTSSVELSRKEVEKQRAFLAMLGLTVAENSESDVVPSPYKADVVYGTASDFEAGILRSEFLGMPLRGERGFQVVVVDEVDAMLVDERSSSTRLSNPTPGMQHLELPLVAVWQRTLAIARRLVNKEGQDYYVQADFEIDGERILLPEDCDEAELLLPVEDKKAFVEAEALRQLKELFRKPTKREIDALEQHRALEKTLLPKAEEIQQAIVASSAGFSSGGLTAIQSRSLLRSGVYDIVFALKGGLVDRKIDWQSWRMQKTINFGSSFLYGASGSVCCTSCEPIGGKHPRNRRLVKLAPWVGKPSSPSCPCCPYGDRVHRPLFDG